MNLTRSQIIELRARAITPKVWVVGKNQWEDRAEPRPEDYEAAKRTISADEAAGVLMLVDEDTANYVKAGDIIKLYHDGKLQYVYHEHQVLKGGVEQIIQRANIPVYHCKKEGILWEEIQDIKNAIGYADKCFCELFPPAEHVVNVANLRHIFSIETPEFMWRKKV